MKKDKKRDEKMEQMLNKMVPLPHSVTSKEPKKVHYAWNKNQEGKTFLGGTNHKKGKPRAADRNNDKSDDMSYAQR